MSIYIEILFKPKKFLEAVPSERITLSSLAIIIALWVNSIIQGMVILKEYAFSITLIFQELTTLVFGVILFSSIFSVSSKALKRKLTFNKIVNIICFSQMPRMYFITIFTLAYLFFPEVLELKLFNKGINSTIFMLTIYSVLLTLYGVVINTKKDNK